MIETKEIAKILDGMIASGSFDSNLGQYIYNHIRQPEDGLDSFYTKILKNQGLEAAEKAMAQWYAESNYREFSSALKEIAIGMRDMALADSEGKYVKLGVCERGPLFPKFYKFKDGSHMISVTNLEWEGFYNIDAPKGMEVFGCDGTIPLISAVIIFSQISDPKMLLFLKTRELNIEKGYAVVQLKNDGNVDIESYVPEINVENYLLFSLGLAPAEDVFRVHTYANSPSCMDLGFPDSRVYLAKHIGSLGQYFSEMAKYLSEEKESSLF